MVHAFNLSTLGAEAGRSLCSSPAWFAECVKDRQSSIVRLCLKSLNLELGVCVCVVQTSLYQAIMKSHILFTPFLCPTPSSSKRSSMWKAAKLGEIRPETERLHQRDGDEGALENPAGYHEDRIDWRRRSLYRAMIAIISSVFTRQNACTLPLPLKGWSLLFCFALPLEQHLRHELLKENGVCVLLSSRGSSLWLPQLQFRHCVKGVIYLIADRKLRKRQGGGRDKISPKGQPSGRYFLQVSFTWDARNLPKHRHVLRRFQRLGQTMSHSNHDNLSCKTVVFS